jgi:tellurite resistance protein TerC
MDPIAAMLTVLQLVFLEGILSIDNAAVLGAMVTPLSNQLPVPWPKALIPLGNILNPILGSQRMAALKVGLLGAYLGRGTMLFLASLVIQNPWIKIIGAFYLIRLSFESLGKNPDAADTEQEGNTRRVKLLGFWLTVLNVEIMDLIFSVDNVVAAVALSKELWVVLVGVAIGIITMRFAAGAFSYLIEREPILREAAFILIFNIAIELLLEDLAGMIIPAEVKFGISVLTLVLAFAYAHLKFLRVFKPVLDWVSQGFFVLNEVINWLLVPFAAIFRAVFQAVRWTFTLFSRPSTPQTRKS